MLLSSNSIDLSILLVWIVLSFMTATLAVCFNHFLKPNMIFNFYGKKLDQIVLYSNLCWKYHKFKPLIHIIAYLSKPLGLCPYCNGTWIALIVFTFYFGIDPAVFLFIGCNWFFIHIIFTKLKP